MKNRTVWSPMDLMDTVKRALSSTALQREQNLVLQVHVQMWHSNWDVQEWLQPHMDRNLAKYRRECHVFRWIMCVDDRTYMHYKLRASSRDWYPCIMVPGETGLAVRYWEGSKKGAVIPARGIPVLLSEPVRSGPAHLECWNVSCFGTSTKETMLANLMKNVCDSLVPDAQQEKFRTDWTECLQMETYSGAREAPANSWMPVGCAFGQRRATELQQELFSSSDVSSGNVVPPLVYTGYSLSQRAKATEAKEHRKQARTNVPLLAGQLLAVARVHSL